jgi:glycosyltransferase involved in cell wall biosynthesis
VTYPGDQTFNFYLLKTSPVFQQLRTMKNRNKQPLISIVMPVFNAAEFLSESLESIRSQTHKNWELIAIDDYSKDNSLEILKNYAKKDKRIKVLQNKRNLGVSSTANKGIKVAKSSWIARMDADDVMHKDRLETQLKTLQKHPSVVALGSQCQLINSKGKRIGTKEFPTCPKDIKNMLFWACPVQQPSIMVNKSKLPKNFIWYNPKTKTGEEINFLLRVSKFGSIVNSRRILLKYRLHNHNLSQNQNQKKVFYNLFKTRLKALVQNQYRPSLISLGLGLAELVIVTLLPQRTINPAFQFIRGMRNLKIKLNLFPSFPNLQAIHLTTN